MSPLLLLLFSASYAAVHVKGAAFFTDKDISIPDNLGLRTKRSACASKFQMFTDSHTACLPGSNASVVSVADQAVIVNSHNEHRAKAKPSATNMLKMKWDDELAMIAQKWAEKCLQKHDEYKDRNIPGRFSVGQNIFWGTRVNWTRAVDAWHSEIQEFVYGDSKMKDNFGAIGHYTQVMWATTVLVGCGMQTCPVGQLAVCNYGPSGNNIGLIHTPYENGPACAKCPGHCANSALCDCQGLSCRNAGTLNISTCTCSCQGLPSLFIGTDCTLNCTETVDKAICTPDKKNAQSCNSLASSCPNLCQVCSYDEIRTETGAMSSAREVVGGVVIFLYLAAAHLLC